MLEASAYKNVGVSAEFGGGNGGAGRAKSEGSLIATSTGGKEDSSAAGGASGRSGSGDFHRRIELAFHRHRRPLIRTHSAGIDSQRSAVPLAAGDSHRCGPPVRFHGRPSKSPGQSRFPSWRASRGPATLERLRCEAITRQAGIGSRYGGLRELRFAASAVLPRDFPPPGEPVAEHKAISTGLGDSAPGHRADPHRGRKTIPIPPTIARRQSPSGGRNRIRPTASAGGRFSSSPRLVRGPPGDPASRFAEPAL